MDEDNNIKKLLKKHYPFKSRFHQLRGCSLHYIDEGEGDPVLMLHSCPVWSFYYREAITQFSKTHRVVAPDYMGCGLSDKPQNYTYSLDHHMNDIESLLLALDLQDITLVMQGWGGVIGMGIAMRHAQRIKSLIVLNSAAFIMPRIHWVLALLKIPYLNNLLVENSNIFLNLSFSFLTHRNLPEEIKECYKYPYMDSNRNALLQFIEDIPLRLENPSFEIALEIEHGLWRFREIPCCIIWGMRDVFFGPRTLAIWRSHLSQAKLVEIKNSKAYVLEDSPDEAIKAMRDFLESL